MEFGMLTLYWDQSTNPDSITATDTGSEMDQEMVPGLDLLISGLVYWPFGYMLSANPDSMNVMESDLEMD